MLFDYYCPMELTDYKMLELIMSFLKNHYHLVRSQLHRTIVIKLEFLICYFSHFPNLFIEHLSIICTVFYANRDEQTQQLRYDNMVVEYKLL